MQEKRQTIVIGAVALCIGVVVGALMMTSGQLGGWATGPVGPAGCGTPTSPITEEQVAPVTKGPMGAQEAIRGAYDQLQYYAPESAALTFEISDFSSIPQAQFSNTAWIDVVDEQNGARIRMLRNIRTAQFPQGEGFERVEFRPSWHGQDEPAVVKGGDKGGSIDRMSIADVLKAAVALVPAATQVTELTSYTVRVQLENRQRTYRATFLWLSGTNGGAASFLVVDNITAGVAQAATEVRTREFDPAILKRMDWLNALSPSSPSCVLERHAEEHLAEQHTDGDDQGIETVRADLDATCLCESDCSCEATATVSNPVCGHEGSVPPLSARTECFVQDSLEFHRYGPSSCSAKALYACGIFSCPFGIVDPSVRIGLKDGESEFEWAGVEINKWTAQTEITCDCTEPGDDSASQAPGL